MKNYLLLTRVLLKSGFGNSTKKTENGTKALMKKYGLPFFILLCLLPTMVMIGVLSKTMYEQLAPLQQEGYFIAVAFHMVCMMNFIFGIFSMVNVFYFSKDIENLLPLPLRAWEIIGAKFSTVVIYNYITELFFLGPVLIGFGYAGRLGIVYWIYGIVAFFFLPLIPLIYASFLTMLMMRFTSFAKNKERFAMVSGVFALAAAIGINIVIQRSIPVMDDPTQLILLMEQGNNSLLQFMTTLFPSVKYASLAISNYTIGNGLINLLMFMAVSILMVIIFIAFSEGIYFKGVIGISETTSKRKGLDNGALEKALKENPLVITYVRKELRLLFRTPIYFLNCVIMNFLFPVFLLIPLFVDPSFISLLKAFGVYSYDTTYTGIGLTLFVAMAVFISATNGITASCISREGKNVFFMKYIPVDYKTQLLSKVLAGVIMGMVGATMIFLVVVCLIPMPIYLMGAAFLSAIPAIFFTNLMGLIFDLRAPKLVWDNEQKAVKQNLNVLYHLLASVTVGAMLIGGALFLKLNLLFAFFLLNITFITGSMVVYQIIKTKGMKWMEEMN